MFKEKNYDVMTPLSTNTYESVKALNKQGLRGGSANSNAPCFRGKHNNKAQAHLLQGLT